MIRVFVSSTGRDLRDHREAVVKAIHGLDGFSPIAMENFGARAAAAVDFDDRKVRESDVLVGLLGLCYGSSPPDGPPSFTEREHDSAEAAGIDRLMLVSPDDFPVAGHLIEPDAQREQQKAFRARVRTAQIVGAFNSPATLASAAMQALVNWRNDRELARALSECEANAPRIVETSSQPDSIPSMDAKGHASFLAKLHQVRKYISDDTRKHIERRVVSDWYESEISK